MRAAARRTGTAGDQPRIQLGDLIVDLAAKRVIRQAPVPASGGPASGGPTEGGPAGAEGQQGNADDIRLTPTEWHLLEVLLRNPGKLLSRNQLLTEVWGPGYADATGNLRLYMAQLRRKLEPDPTRPRWLITEPGMGYRYQPSPDEDA
jgi:two-component system, OmpR family, KDP operon response regulator KdpE